MKLLNRYEAWWPVRIVLDETQLAPLNFMKQIGNADKNSPQSLKDIVDLYINIEMDASQTILLISEIRRNMTKSRILIFEQILKYFRDDYKRKKTTELIESLDLWNNRDFVHLFSLNGYIDYLPQIWKTDKVTFMLSLRRIDYTYRTLPIEFLNDREVMLRAVYWNGELLRKIPLEMKDDREIIKAAVEQNVYAFQYVAYELDKRDIFLTAVQRNGMALKVTCHFKEDREIVMAAVKQNGLALQYACFKLQLDSEIVLAAVKQNADAYQYASYECQVEPEIMEAAGTDMSITFF